MEDQKNTTADLPDIMENKNTPIIKDQKKAVKKPVVKNNLSKKDASVPESKPADDMRTLLEKNLKLSEKIFEQNKKIKSRLTMMVVGNYLRLLLIIVPLIIAFIFLPPMLNQIFSQYNELLGGSGTMDFSKIFSPGLNTDPTQLLKNLKPEDMAKIQEVIKNAPKP